MAVTHQSSLYFSGIDAVRFLAALSVVGFHLGYLHHVGDIEHIWPATWFGWVGVEVFFVISGFVIANSATGRSAMQFVQGRALRLYPAAWCCATLTFIVACQDQSAIDLLPYPDQSFIALLPSYLRSIALLPKGPWIDGIYWTLAVEIGFYALIFILLWTNLFSWLSQIALAITIFSIISIYFIAVKSPLAAVIDHANVVLARHGCFFAIGIWIWISVSRRLAAWEIAGSAAAVFACLMEIYLKGIEYLPDEHPNWILAPLIVWTLATASIFVLSRYGSREPTSNILKTFGLMTYPLYLVHNTVGTSFERSIFPLVGKWGALLSSLSVMIVISWVVCQLLEPQIRKLMRRNWNRKRIIAN
jgi:exopolysaccharide production protein ExoZ